MDLKLLSACSLLLLLACGGPTPASQPLDEPAPPAEPAAESEATEPYAELMLQVFEEDLAQPQDLVLDQFSLSFCGGVCRKDGAALQRSVPAETVYLVSPNDFAAAQKAGDFTKLAMKPMRLVAKDRKVFWQPREGQRRQIGTIEAWHLGGFAVALGEKGQTALLVSDLDAKGKPGASRLWGTPADRRMETEIGNDKILVIMTVP